MLDRRILLVFGICSIISAEQNTADPNMIGCGVEQRSVMQVKAGNIIEFGHCTIGGFFESRNEPPFNKNVLPNHDWRGFFSASARWTILRQVQSSVSAVAALEHESAHATMGIVEEYDDSYYMIFDNTYRKLSLNSFKAGARIFMYDRVQTFQAYTTLDGYMNSKNTPELPGLETASTVGCTIGGYYRYAFRGFTDVFLSMHERRIFESGQNRQGDIYVLENETIVKTGRKYPIVAATNTFSVCAGIGCPLFQSRHRFELYGRWLHGSPFGYVDSRYSGNRFAAGIVIGKWLP